MTQPLTALADHDEAIARARHAAAHLGSQGAFDEATAELRELAVQKRDLDELVGPLADRVAVLEREATEALDRANVIAARLSSATGAGRDLAAMEEERAHLESRASQLEDDQLAALEELEPLEASAETLRARAADAVRRRDAAASSLEVERTHADAAVAALLADRPALASALDPALLARYEAVAKKTGTSGAARLVDGRCGGCRVAVPAAVADRLAHSADLDAIETCDECGRLLVR